jgi:tetratricopeptide (TPR) repeat protein
MTVSANNSPNHSKSTHQQPDDQPERNISNERLPKWKYQPPPPEQRQYVENEDILTPPALEGAYVPNLGKYTRQTVTNIDNANATTDPITARAYFDLGLRLMLCYQHEIAYKCFLAAVQKAPYCALAHGLIALCHSPNYNFKGEPYYKSTCHDDEATKHDLLCLFPSQHVAERHGRLAVQTVETIRRLHRNKNHNRVSSNKNNKNDNNKARRNNKSNNNNNNNNINNQENANTDSLTLLLLPDIISDAETQLLSAIRVLTCIPGVDPGLSVELVGRPFANAMRKVYQKYPHDPEIVYCFAEALMVLNAWCLYEYPSGKPVSPDVEETRAVLERALAEHPHHAGLCHLYVHLSEMSAHPDLALSACRPLREEFPDAGHLLHMGTHIDVLVGDYEACVRYNHAAIVADKHVMAYSPSTAGKESFYFGYIVHNYHMLVFGAILGGMEQQARIAAYELNEIITEDMFNEYPNLAAYLESYSALDVHVLVRFGRWKEILELELPKNKTLMLFRSASIRYARGLAFAARGDVVEAKREADRLDTLRNTPEAKMRILHNNDVDTLLAVDAVMLRGEIAYREENYDFAFAMLRRAVEMQDNLNYDEPWGKMQPIRHALGGLLLEQGRLEEATEVFRFDLKFHPKNPFALVGLIECIKRSGSSCCSSSKGKDTDEELKVLQEQLRRQRSLPWSDFDVAVACECCHR